MANVRVIIITPKFFWSYGDYLAIFILKVLQDLKLKIVVNLLGTRRIRPEEHGTSIQNKIIKSKRVIQVVHSHLFSVALSQISLRLFE